VHSLLTNRGGASLIDGKRRVLDEANRLRHTCIWLLRCSSSCCAFIFASTRAALSFLGVTVRASLSLLGVTIRASLGLGLLIIFVGTGSGRAIAIMVGLIEAAPFEDDTSGEEDATNLRSTFRAGG